MGRVVKDAEVRRDELLDTALALFLEHGYESTSVEQVTQAAGIAKGTFYHYFDSKSAILGAIAERFGEQIFNQTEAAMAEMPGNALDRFRAFMNVSSATKLERMPETETISRSMFCEENVVLQQRLFDVWFERTRPLLRDVVADGAAEGTFRVADVDGTTEVLLSLLYDYGRRIAEKVYRSPDFESGAREALQAVAALEMALERVLGLPDGGLGLDFRARAEKFIG